jgi:pyruvate kinase
MIRAGMSVARINFSHGTHDEHARRITAVRRLADEEQKLVAVMGDLQGPKYRVGDIPGGVNLVRDHVVMFSSQQAFTSSYELTIVPMPHAELIAAMQPGNRVLIDDGALELCVTGAPDHGGVLCRVVTGGMLTSHKGVAVPGTHLAVSSITEKDRVDIAFAVDQKLDALALSFVRTAADVRALRAILTELKGEPYIVAKIEKPEAVEDLPNILTEVDVIMVARGDLGIEAPAEEVPFFQKKIIRSCLMAGVPVITATQMLQSMIHAPQPTRAEASDVANAVLDGTDAVMLSAETAAGEYPVESVRALATIASRAESEWRNDALAALHIEQAYVETGSAQAVTNAITTAVADISHEVGASVIVCTTSTGFTARMVARHRPSTPIIVMTPSHRTRQFTAFMWDVQAFERPVCDTVDEMFEVAAKYVLQAGYAKTGERIVITASLPLGHGAGKTNLIKIHTV